MKSEQVLFGERLRAALKIAGYAESAAQLARMLDKFGGLPSTPQAVSRWLRGKSVPRQQNLKALAKMCRIDPQTLQYGVESNGSRIGEEPAQFRVNALDQHAIDAFIVLPIKQRRLIRDLIDELSEWKKRG